MSELQPQGIALASAVGSTTAYVLAPRRFRPVTTPLLIAGLGSLLVLGINEVIGVKLQGHLDGLDPPVVSIGQQAWLVGELVNLSRFRDETVMAVVTTIGGPVNIVPLPNWSPCPRTPSACACRWVPGQP